MYMYLLRLQITHLSILEEFCIIKDSSYSFSPSGVLLNIVNIPAQVFQVERCSPPSLENLEILGGQTISIWGYQIQYG